MLLANDTSNPLVHHLQNGEIIMPDSWLSGFPHPLNLFFLSPSATGNEIGLDSCFSAKRLWPNRRAMRHLKRAGI